MICEKCKKELRQTGLYDRLIRPICYGNIVHWTDGGDELDLESRIKTRWDRIAIVDIDIIVPVFRVIDSPSQEIKNKIASYPDYMEFNFGSFIYKDTQKYLTIVAESQEEYFQKFKNAGECMKYVLEITSETNNKRR